MKLTKTVIDAIEPTARDQTFWDDDMPGFGVRIYPSGVKSFILKKRIGIGRGARQKLFVIGNCNLMTPTEARHKAQDVARKARDGDDGRLPHAQMLTVSEIMKLYLERHTPETKSQDDAIKTAKRDIIPLLGKRRFLELTKHDVREMKRIVGQRSQSSANKALRYLKAAINFAKDEFEEHLGNKQNPCTRVKPFDIGSRNVFVNHEDMPRLLMSIKEDHDPYGRGAIMLYLLTGQRKSEILSLRRDQIDFANKRLYLPGKKTKNKKDHYVPLSDAAMDVIRKIPPVLGSPWLFPSVHYAMGYTGKSHLKDIRPTWDRIRDRAKLRSIKIHDLRRTVASWMIQDGESISMIGKILNHSDPSVTWKAYAHFQDNNIREALNRYADKVLGI